MKYIIVIRRGNIGTRSMLMSRDSRIICSSYMKHKQVYPRTEWVEHDPMEIWENTKQVVGDVIKEACHKGIYLDDIKGIEIASQGETVMLWDKTTGIPIYNAIIRNNRRISECIEKLEGVSNYEKDTHHKAGVTWDIYFLPTKIKWILDNVEGAKEKLFANQVAAGTLDTWLIWKMTGEKSFVTDVSTASRAILFNKNSLKWDDEVLNALNIPKCILAEVLSDDKLLGITDKRDFLGLELPIYSLTVNNLEALFERTCFDG